MFALHNIVHGVTYNDTVISISIVTAVTTSVNAEQKHNKLNRNWTRG